MATATLSIRGSAFQKLLNESWEPANLIVPSGVFEIGRAAKVIHLPRLRPMDARDVPQMITLTESLTTRKLSHGRTSARWAGPVFRNDP
jgi:hypothetical protein